MVGAVVVVVVGGGCGGCRPSTDPAARSLAPSPRRRSPPRVPPLSLAPPPPANKSCPDRPPRPLSNRSPFHPQLEHTSCFNSKLQSTRNSPQHTHTDRVCGETRESVVVARPLSNRGIAPCGPPIPPPDALGRRAAAFGIGAPSRAAFGRPRRAGVRRAKTTPSQGRERTRERARSRPPPPLSVCSPIAHARAPLSQLLGSPDARA